MMVGYEACVLIHSKFPNSVKLPKQAGLETNNQRLSVVTTINPNKPDNNSSVTHDLLVRFLHQFIASSDPKDIRRKPPQLRPFAISLFALVVFSFIGLLVLALCVKQMRLDLQARLEQSESALSQVLADIERDLRALPVATASACDVNTQQDITRMSLNSVLVREFFIQPKAAEDACGSFGKTYAYWRLLSNETGFLQGVQIVPTESIRSSVVVAVVRDQIASVAVIDPRQLLDRLPRLQSHETLSIKALTGFNLASTADTNKTSVVSSIEKPVTGWPLVLLATLPEDALFEALRSQGLFWLITSTLLTILLVLGINRRLQRHGSKARRLENALKKRRFAPVVQPIVCAATGVCVGVEVLMRWKHPVRGLVAPAEFIDYAERSGLIVPMSDLLMRQAHQQLADIAIAHPSLYFSFNITPAQLRTLNFSQTLLEIFDGKPLGPDRVLLELTERDLVDEQVRDELTRLRARGFQIAIDDFGTGQSSLAVLQDLPIDKLKIDRAFVNTITSQDNSQPVLDAIISLAHRLNIEMVAEGIEQPMQAAYLKEKKVQSLQGYYFAKPMPPLDFSTWLKSNIAKLANEVIDSSKTTAKPGFDLNEVLRDLQPARARLERNRWNYLRRHRNCLLGSELVSWLAERYGITRREALRLGKRLVALGFLTHVFEEHDLEDKPFFYRLLSMAAANESIGTSMQVNKSTGQLLSLLQGNGGLKPGMRYSKGLAFTDAVSGSEVVDTFVRLAGLNHQEACAAAVQLMRGGLIKHCFDELGFVDSKAHHYHLN
jgi:sensor c-di-GMP phosphodiesterase-like protein